MGATDSRFIAALVALSIVFGSAFLVMKVVADEATALEIVTVRLSIGAVVLAALVQWRSGGVRAAARASGKGAVLGVFKVLSFGLSAWAIKYMDSGTGAVLNSTIPIFTGVFAAVFIAEERLTANRAGGLVAGFAGVAVLAGGAVFDASTQTMVAQLAQVGAAASLAMSGVWAKRLLTSGDALSLSWAQISAGAALAWVVLLVFQGAPSLDLSAQAWAGLIVLGAVQNGIAWAAYVWLIERAGSVRASLLTYLMPAVGLFLGWAFLEEQVTLATIGGLALIICGIAIVMRPGKALRITSPAQTPSAPPGAAPTPLRAQAGAR
jgi:drug/metabolite transporter (DMT)-like permease